ncbi:hypothetical protein BCM14_0863 [Jezberella montanilacus]|uniref:DUF1178 family protein n=1 Tax=Jezberella montanilacus TaxID=323426 RepID=A0A2T0XKD6_9BURK|nr:DUF1178 family protein [Jezberella montanilacus]PRY99418.1 hypothetical protein BCM14_0863 [Jezberella montanilacus]
MGLKVFDLQCGNLHVFEGWFGSHEEYDTQQSRGLVTCPMCQNDQITKKLSAPRLNVGHFHEDAKQGGNRREAEVTHAGGQDIRQVMAPMPISNEIMQLQAAVMQQMREYVRKTENVGTRFAEEARAIHEGDAVERPIRGVASPDEQRELIEEGIAIVALPEFLDADRLQ